MATKEKAEVTTVRMEDGRTVEFVGKRKVLKDVIIDKSKVEVADGVIQLSSGAVGVRFDLISGATRTFFPPVSLYPEFLGHGQSQKYGDELATPADKPLSSDDQLLALEDLDSQIQKGEWRAKAEGGGGVSGASIVLQAFLIALNEMMAAQGKPPKDIAFVKDYMQKQLDAAKAKGEDLSRKALYDSFRNPNSKVGKIIARLEAEKAAKTAKVDADSELAAAAG